MPAKKTFHSIRVRGTARFDNQPTHNGVSLPIYREYVALLNQSGSDDPTATVLRNTLGGEPVWSREGEGNYRLDLVGGFPADKTFIFAYCDGGDLFSPGWAVAIPFGDFLNVAVGLDPNIPHDLSAMAGFARVEVRVYLDV